MKATPLRRAAALCVLPCLLWFGCSEPRDAVAAKRDATTTDDEEITHDDASFASDAGESVVRDAASAASDSAVSRDAAADASGPGAADAARDAGVDTDAGHGGDGGDAGPVGAGTAPNSTWSALTAMQVENPMNHGAAGNGSADDLPALRAAIAALPATGGIVFFPSGKSFKKNDLLVITKDHVKLWAINREAELVQAVNGQRRRQSILCRNTGCGVVGLKLRSDASARFDALEDNQISADHASLVEVAGCEIQGAAAVGVMLFGSKEHYIEGNFIHHTWADHIHHTEGATASWVWSNFILNEAPSKGDDGIACVTYGPNSARCADMEWWSNTVLHSDWGRGYSIIGGENITIHHNWAIGVAGAGIIVASESSYDTSASQGIRIADNYVQNCGHTIGHPGILISGQSAAAGPLRDIALDNNVSVGTPAGAYRAEGTLVNVTNVGLATEASALPGAAPTRASIELADTRVLRTRDVSHVPANVRTGLYRIHVRLAPSGTGFQQRFEYVLRGPSASVSAFSELRAAAGDYVSERRASAGSDYVLLLSANPIAVPEGLSAVTFRELRQGDRDGTLRWLWARLDAGDY
jgi:Right handed beta helix region